MNSKLTTPEASRKNLETALKQLKKSESAKEQAAKKLDEQKRRLAKQQESIAVAERALEAEKISAKQAEMAAKRAQAEIVPDRVTLEVATETAEALLRAFDNHRNPGESTQPTDPRLAGVIPHHLPEDSEETGDRAELFWQAVDAARDRLLTDAVDDDAILVVLAVEGIIHACERWEMAREGKSPGGSLSNNDRETMGECPAANRRIEAAEKELRAVLAGEEPKKSESIGRLIASGVGFEQVCRMAGLVYPGGFVGLAELGSICDSGDPHQAAFDFVHWHGCLAVDRAWGRRQAQVANRRSKNRTRVQASAHGSIRPAPTNAGVVTTEDREDAEFEEFAAFRAEGALAQLRDQRLQAAEPEHSSGEFNPKT